MSPSEEDRATFAAVKAKFEGFFRVRRNTIIERVRFNRRVQQEGEPVEQFIVSLHSLAENCAYGDLKEEMVRDRLVVGIRDAALSERLQMDAELTLAKAMKMVRQREAVHEQQHILREGDTPIKVEAVTGKAGASRYRQRQKRQQTHGCTARQKTAEEQVYSFRGNPTQA